MKEHCDFLKDIWRGSPGTTALSFGIDSDLLGPNESDSLNESSDTYSRSSTPNTSHHDGKLLK